MTGLSLLSSSLYIPSSATEQTALMQNQSGSNLEARPASVGDDMSPSFVHIPEDGFSDVERQEIIAAAINHGDIKAWSNGWRFVNMDLAGTNDPEPHWETAIVDLHLPPTANAPVFCDKGWWARVEIDLSTKKVLSSDHPTPNKDCHGEIPPSMPIETAGTNDSENPVIQTILPKAYAAGQSALAFASQHDVITYNIYGSTVNLKTPTVSSTIYTNMDTAVGHLLTQYFKDSTSYFAQAGWIVTTVAGCPGCNIPADSKKIVYIDRSVYGDYEARAVTASGFSWVNDRTLVLNIICGTSNYSINFGYGSAIYSHTTNIPCSKTLRSDNVNNGIWFENKNTVFDNWYDYISSDVKAWGAYEFRGSPSTWYTWISSYNRDMSCTKSFSPSSVIYTGNVQGGGTAYWDRLWNMQLAC